MLKSLKWKTKQILCRHKHTEQMVKTTPFYNLRGEEVYTVCKRCKKIITSVFYEYEGNGYK